MKCVCAKKNKKNKMDPSWKQIFILVRMWGTDSLSLYLLALHLFFQWKRIVNAAVILPNISFCVHAGFEQHGGEEITFFLGKLSYVCDRAILKPQTWCKVQPQIRNVFCKRANTEINESSFQLTTRSVFNNMASLQFRWCQACKLCEPTDGLI